MTPSAALERSGYPLWHPMTDMRRYLEEPVTIVRGDGVRVWDQDGRAYLSATGGLWNVACGFARQEIMDAIAAQLRLLPYGTLFRFGNEPAELLAQRLVEILPEGLTRVFFTTSGSTATDAAIKAARRYFHLLGQPAKRRVISLSRSYHGTTIGAMSVTGEDLEHEAYGLDRRDVIIMPTPRPTWCTCQTEGLQAADECSALLAEIAEREGDKVAAVILEPILGSAGVLELPQTFLERVRGVCDEHDILLIVDEVATGFGRTGRMFASEWFDLQPDIVILSKGINSGYLPLGAAAFGEKIFEAFWRTGAIFLHGETQAGNPLACAAGLATLEVIEKEGLVARAEEVGARLLETLRGLERHQHVACVGGRGLMLGVHLAREEGRGLPVGTDAVILAVRQLAREGLLVHPAPSGISLFPPLVLSEADADRVAELLDLVLGRLVLA